MGRRVPQALPGWGRAWVRRPTLQAATPLSSRRDLLVRPDLADKNPGHPVTFAFQAHSKLFSINMSPILSG